MKILKREEWLADTNLKMWIMKSARPEKRCQCGTKDNWVELIDHESCMVGRIDTIVCTKCNEVESFNIIR